MADFTSTQSTLSHLPQESRKDAVRYMLRYKELYSDATDREAVCGGTLGVIRSLIAEVQAVDRTAEEACERIAYWLDKHDQEIAGLARAVEERRRAAATETSEELK